MSVHIAPALTAKQWADGAKQWPDDIPGDGARIELREDGTISITSAGGRFIAAPDARHALAAMCLYQRPFGFTVDDFDTLFQVQIAWQRAVQASGKLTGEMSERIRNIDSLRERIAALLPPEEIRKAYEP